MRACAWRCATVLSSARYYLHVALSAQGRLRRSSLPPLFSLPGSHRSHSWAFTTATRQLSRRHTLRSIIGGGPQYVVDICERTSYQSTRVSSPGPGQSNITVQGSIPPLPVPSNTPSAIEARAKHHHQVQMTLILLSVFHTHTSFLLDRLGNVLDPGGGTTSQIGAGIAYTPTDNIVLTARDVMALELGPLSDLDARFVQWLAEKADLSGGRKVVVRRSWRDLLAAVFGFG